MTNYKNLEAWKKAMALVKIVHLLTKQYPKEELYDLISYYEKSTLK